MRWEDEQYVRLYTRDTVTWKLLPWQSKALLPLLLRKLDRAGVLDLGGDGNEGIAAATDMPLALIEEGMPELLRRGTFVMNADRLVMPNFLPAQTAAMSDKARKQAQRERDRAAALAPPERPEPSDSVTKRDAESRTVTDGHDRSRAVTIGHSELSCTELISEKTKSPPETSARSDADSSPRANAAPDEIPHVGTPAHAVYLTLVDDRHMHATVRAPGRWAIEATDPERYPALNVLSEIKRAIAWQHANPKKRKRDGNRFLTNWLLRAQEKGGDRQAELSPRPAVARGFQPAATAADFAAARGNAPVDSSKPIAWDFAAKRRAL